jgi:drug/metabolite transporter (DMT)-like permease
VIPLARSPNEAKPAARLNPVFWVVVTAALTGAAPVLTKSLLTSTTSPLSPATILTWRYLLALLLVGPMAFFAPRRLGEKPPASQRTLASKLCLGVVAIFGSGIAALLFTVSLLHAPAAVTNGLSRAGPLFVAFMAYVWLQEDVSFGSISMVAAMLIAAAMLSTGQSGGSESTVAEPLLLGAGLAVAAGILRATSEVAAKAALNAWHPSHVAAARFGGGAVLALAYGLISHSRGELLLPTTLQHWGVLLILAWVCTALPIVVYYSAVRSLPIHLAVGLRTSGTAITAILSWIALGEHLAPVHILGLAALLLVAYAMAHLPSEAPRRVPRMTRLSSRLVTFVAAVVAIAVMLTGALQAWQLYGVVSSQTEASLARAAVFVSHLVDLQPQVPASVTQSYFDRLVRDEISGGGYPAEFSYIILANDEGVPQAFAFRPDDWPQGMRSHMAQTLAREGPDTFRRPDLLPVHFPFVTPTGTRMHLYAGYRAGLLWGRLASLALRTILLAALLALVAAYVAGSLVRGALAPLAGMSAELRREIADARTPTHRPSAGEPALPDQANLALLAGMADLLASDASALPDLAPPPDAVLAALTPPQSVATPTELKLWLNDAILLAAELDGAVVGIWRGSLLVAWGLTEAEEDDPLRAYAWCVGVAASEGFLFASADWDRAMREELAPAPGTSTTEGFPLRATAGLMDRAAARLQGEPLDDNLFLILGEAD